MNEWVGSTGGMILTGETEVLGEKHYTAWVVDEWMSIQNWWNDTDRGNWSTGRKTLYSVGGRWMNEYGALVEWYWQGKLKYWGEELVPLPLCPSQILPVLAWDQTHASKLTGWQLITWLMSQPQFWVTLMTLKNKQLMLWLFCSNGKLHKYSFWFAHDKL